MAETKEKWTNRTVVDKYLLFCPYREVFVHCHFINNILVLNFFLVFLLLGLAPKFGEISLPFLI